MVKHRIHKPKSDSSILSYATKCPNGGIGRHSGLRSRGVSLRVRVSLWVQHTYSLTDRTSGYEPDNGSSNLSKCTKYGYGAMVAYGSPKPLMEVRIFLPVQNGGEANLVEALDWKSRGSGSIPLTSTNWNVAQWLEQDPYTVKVMGSNPFIPTKSS